ncbi:MAG: SMC-Scp complex subunit ScpB [Candidatus Aenigmarchaeota archaeon]|nr:SMC-Scp complex subunit ScpB [Candidatus Aenigmarchaeota archaeon]
MNLKKIALLEAILFTTTEPLNFEELQKLTRSRKDELEKLLAEMNGRYAEEAHGIRLTDIGGYKLIVKSEFIAA